MLSIILLGKVLAVCSPGERSHSILLQMLEKALADECQTVVEMTNEIQSARNARDLQAMYENLRTLKGTFAESERQLLTIPAQNPNSWQSWKLIQELAVLIHGYEQSLEYRRSSLESGFAAFAA